MKNAPRPLHLAFDPEALSEATQKHIMMPKPSTAPWRPVWALAVVFAEVVPVMAQVKGSENPIALYTYDVPMER